MDDELLKREAAVQLEDLLVFSIFQHTDPRLDRDRKTRPVAYLLQEPFEFPEVSEKAGTPPLGNDRPGRAPQVQVHLRIAHIGKHLRRPHELVCIVGEQLRNYVETLVALRVDLFIRLAAKRRAYLRRSEERSVVAVEGAEALRVDPAKYASRDPLHGGKREYHRRRLPFPSCRGT